MKRLLSFALAACAAGIAFGEGTEESPELRAFKEKVAAAHPGLEVVKVEEEVQRRAYLAPVPEPAVKPPVMAIFVKNLTNVPGMDDKVDGIRDRLAAEVSGLDFVVMDSAEIASAFNKYKITTAEERAGLVNGLFTGGSVTRVAQMLGADYILAASITGASRSERVAGDRVVAVYTLRMSSKVLDAASGGSVYGKNWTNRRPVTNDGGSDPLAIYDDLVDTWVGDMAMELADSRPRWRKISSKAALASFTVKTTIDADIEQLSAGVDAATPVKEELRVVAGGIVVEVDGTAVGTSGGTFRVSPGLHQLRVSRAWMTPWTGTVNIVDGAVFNIALELSPEGLKHYGSKEALRAEVATAYAEAAFKRGVKVNFDTSAWQGIVTSPAAVMPVAPVAPVALPVK